MFTIIRKSNAALMDKLNADLQRQVAVLQQDLAGCRSTIQFLDAQVERERNLLDIERRDRQRLERELVLQLRHREGRPAIGADIPDGPMAHPLSRDEADRLHVRQSRELKRPPRPNGEAP